MLLPKDAPDVSGLQIDARYTPAQKVSGDYYDVFELSGGRLGVVVADVSGKTFSSVISCKSTAPAI